jgi:hypothetical protein
MVNRRDHQLVGPRAFSVISDPDGSAFVDADPYGSAAV